MNGRLDDVTIEVEFFDGRWMAHFRSRRWPAWHPVIYGADAADLLVNITAEFARHYEELLGESEALRPAWQKQDG